MAQWRTAPVPFSYILKTFNSQLTHASGPQKVLALPLRNELHTLRHKLASSY
jgi:hypothetical protein